MGTAGRRGGEGIHVDTAQGPSSRFRFTSGWAHSTKREDFGKIVWSRFLQARWPSLCDRSFSAAAAWAWNSLLSAV